MTGTASHAPEPPLDVVVVGEALIDIVQSADGQKEYPGGSPANVAYGLGLLDVKTGLLTAIGRDERGDAIAAHLRRAGVVLLPGSMSAGKTATATARITADGSADYTFDIDWALAPLALPYAPRILHTGSIATFLEPGASVVRSLLEQAQGGCMVTYDPQYPPRPPWKPPRGSVPVRGDGAADRRRKNEWFRRPLAVPRQVVGGYGEPPLGPWYGGACCGDSRSQGSAHGNQAHPHQYPGRPGYRGRHHRAGDSFTAALIMGGLLLRGGSDGMAPLCWNGSAPSHPWPPQLLLAARAPTLPRTVNCWWAWPASRGVSGSGVGSTRHRPGR